MLLTNKKAFHRILKIYVLHRNQSVGQPVRLMSVQLSERTRTGSTSFNMFASLKMRPLFTTSSQVRIVRVY